MQGFSFPFLTSLLLFPVLSVAKEHPQTSVRDLAPGDIERAYAQHLSCILAGEVSKIGKYEVYGRENLQTTARWIGRSGKISPVSLNFFDTRNVRAGEITKFCSSEDTLIKSHAYGFIATPKSGQLVYANWQSKGSFYNDDAPPLVWPSWLQQYGNTRPLQPVERKARSETYLESRYQAGAPMADLHQFYEDLVKTNGYRLVTSQITTSQSVKGNIVFAQPYGLVEACLSEDGTASGPRTCMKALFSGKPDGPVTVTLQVKVMGSFGRR
jgi:hypothetical protein